MCSIEEAWAGQTFEGKNVVSQADMHNTYMSLPDNALTRDNEFSISNKNQQQPRSLSRGINSKYSREPRIPNKNHNINNADISISSQMPKINNYGGLEPLPSYMSIYNQSNQSNESNQSNQSNQSNHPYPLPIPTKSGEQFTDINNAYNVSKTLSNFMDTNITKYNKKLDYNLLNEDTEEDINIINNKFNNIENKKDKFINVNNDHDNHKNVTDNDMHEMQQILQMQQMLSLILNKIEKIEQSLNTHNKKNMYDIILYIMIGMLLSFIFYSILSSMRKK